MKDSIKNLLAVFTATFLKLFLTDLKIRKEKKSCSNQLGNYPLVIDFELIQKNMTVEKIQFNEMYFYCELKIKNIFEKKAATNKVHSLMLVNGFTKPDYMKDAFIKSFIYSKNKATKQSHTKSFNALFIDSDKNSHNTSQRNWHFTLSNFPKLNQAQYTSIKRLLNNLYLSNLEVANIEAKKLAIKKLTSKSK